MDTPITSRLFCAALELLRENGDRSAAIAQVRDVFPGASATECDRVLREAATALYVK